MKENGDILKVLTEMLSQQGQMLGQQKMMVAEMKESKRLLNRHEDILMHILEALQDDIPKYDELIEIENVKRNKIVLRKTK